jgi:hypothetical protein
MKKILLVLMAFVSVLIVSGQIHIGVKAGLNLADQLFTPATNGSNFSTITNFNAGVFASLPIAKNLTLQPEIMYSGCGAKYSEQDGDTSNYHFDYITIPVLLKYTSSIGIFAEVGPQIGFVLSAKEDNLSNSSTSDVKPYYNTTDFSAVFGVGYISTINLGFDFRYNLGLSNLIKNTNEYHLKNSVFQFGLFYIFNLKKKSK